MDNSSLGISSNTPNPVPNEVSRSPAKQESVAAGQSEKSTTSPDVFAEKSLVVDKSFTAQQQPALTFNPPSNSKLNRWYKAPGADQPEIIKAANAMMHLVTYYQNQNLSMGVPGSWTSSALQNQSIQTLTNYLMTEHGMNSQQAQQTAMTAWNDAGVETTPFNPNSAFYP